MITWNWITFLLGALGAFAPEILRLWKIRNSPEKFSWSWFYLIISIVFCALGGIFSIAMEPDKAWKAIYIGISLPVIITKALEQAKDQTSIEHHKSTHKYIYKEETISNPTFWKFISAL